MPSWVRMNATALHVPVVASNTSEMLESRERVAALARVTRDVMGYSVISRGGTASARGAFTPQRSGPERQPAASSRPGARSRATLDRENGVVP